MAYEMITVGACVIGIIFFFVAIIDARNILRLFPKHSKLRRYWNIKLALLLTFTGGYVVVIIAILMSNLDILAIMQSIVYFLGAVFVWFVARVSLTTYKSILEEEEPT